MTKLVLWLSVMMPLIYSAGPANITMAALGARFGLKNTMPFLAGINLVVMIATFAIGFGMSNILLNFSHVFPYLQLAGALYMFYLAYKFFRSGKKVEGSEETVLPKFIDGVILQVFNAKMFMINIMMFSQFLDNGSALVGQVLLLAFGAISMAFSANVLWAAGGAWLMRSFTSGRALRMQSYVFGSMLALVGGWMCYEGWPF